MRHFEKLETLIYIFFLDQKEAIFLTLSYIDFSKSCWPDCFAKPRDDMVMVMIRCPILIETEFLQRIIKWFF